MKKDHGLHWGLVSTYRQEIMGIACLWVILHHNFCKWPNALELVRELGICGNAGVDVFLFLSGISLYFAYIRKPKLSRFYARRIFRLLVPFALLAAPYWIWRDCLLQKGNFWQDFSMLSFPMKGTITTWYVGAIFVFYLVYPLAYRLIFKVKQLGSIKFRRNTLAILLPAAVAFGCLVLRKICPGLYDNIEIGLTRTVIFLIGCRVGEWVYRKKQMPSEWLWLSGIYLAFMLVLRETVDLPAYWIRMSYAPLAVSVTVLLTGFFHQFSWKPLQRVLLFFGDRSLEIYLSHVMLKNVYLYYFPVTQWDRWGFLSYGLVVAIALIISTIVHPIGKWICNCLQKS